MRLFEYHHTLLHQKVMTIDGMWSAVRSSNFDDRSLETNNELTLGILDADFARNAIFETYVQRAEQVTLDAWRRAEHGTSSRTRRSTCFINCFDTCLNEQHTKLRVDSL